MWAAVFDTEMASIPTSPEAQDAVVQNGRVLTSMDGNPASPGLFPKPPLLRGLSKKVGLKLHTHQLTRGA